MAFYYLLRYDFKEKPVRDTVIDNLIRLKGQINEQIPDKDLENNLLLATWNIRDFGKTNRRGYGSRSKDSLFYIAEIISSFDLVAVQEVNELDEWDRVMRILGPDWDYIATDVADSRAGGNGERMTFVFDRRKVHFRNIAGEIVLPPNLLISKTTFEVEGQKVVGGKQFRRTPFVVSFQAGWFKFDICTVHIYYGEDSGDGLQERIEEIGTIAKYLSDRANVKIKQDGKATILLGDFNIISPGHKTMAALLDNGFLIPKEIKSRKSNVIETKHYDQIAFKSDKNIIDYVDKGSPSPKSRNAGVFKIFESVFRDEDFDFYKDEVKKSGNSKKQTTDVALKKYYKEWKTYQMSDHNPMWVRLNVNESIDYLEKLKK